MAKKRQISEGPHVHVGDTWSLAPWVSAVYWNLWVVWVSILPGLSDPNQEVTNSCLEVFLKVPLHKQAENDSLLNLKRLYQQNKNLAQKNAFSQLHIIHWHSETTLQSVSASARPWFHSSWDNPHVLLRRHKRVMVQKNKSHKHTTTSIHYILTWNKSLGPSKNHTFIKSNTLKTLNMLKQVAGKVY